MEYYSAIKNNEILPFPTIWMELEGIMLSEINQRKKDKYHMISLICGIKKTKQNEQKKKTNKNKLIGKEVRLLVTRGEGGWWGG